MYSGRTFYIYSTLYGVHTLNTLNTLDGVISGWDDGPRSDVCFEYPVCVIWCASPGSSYTYTYTWDSYRDSSYTSTVRVAAAVAAAVTASFYSRDTTNYWDNSRDNSRDSSYNSYNSYNSSRNNNMASSTTLHHYQSSKPSFPRPSQTTDSLAASPRTQMVAGERGGCETVTGEGGEEGGG